MMSYAIAAVAVVAMSLSWVAVQRAWARQFPDAFDDPDVLAGRRSCAGCGCAIPCQRGAADDRAQGRNPDE